MKFSIFDSVPLTSENARLNFLQLGLNVQYAETLSFHRYWIAEHHTYPGCGGVATSILVNQIANLTNTIRVGGGGVCLPHHSPLMVAETYATLDNLNPGRIDLGLGRAVARNSKVVDEMNISSLDHPTATKKVLGFLDGDGNVKLIPQSKIGPDVYMLGSGTESAELAGELGLPFCFGYHYKPFNLKTALDIYRSTFKESKYLKQPYVIVCTNFLAAATNYEAHRLFTTYQQLLIDLLEGDPDYTKPPFERAEEYHTYGSTKSRNECDRILAGSIVGSRETVSREMANLIEISGADEIMIKAHNFDPGVTIISWKIFHDLFI